MTQRSKAIVLLRGLAKESRHWKDTTDHLQELMPSFQILPLDLAGNGQFHKEKSPISMKEAVLRLRKELFKKLPPYEKTSLYLVGISMGGMIATSWHQQFPEDFQKMVLMNTSFKSLSPFYERLLLKSYFKLLQVALTRNPKTKEKRLLEIISNLPERQKIVLPAWVRIREENPVTLINTLRQLWLSWQNKTLPKWDIPCLLLASKKDRLVSWKCSEKIHKNCGLPLVFHPEAGHALSVDDPKWVADQISYWIDHEKISKPQL